jgi:hypothetical protein
MIPDTNGHSQGIGCRPIPCLITLPERGRIWHLRNDALAFFDGIDYADRGGQNSQGGSAERTKRATPPPQGASPTRGRHDRAGG